MINNQFQGWAAQHGMQVVPAFALAPVGAADEQAQERLRAAERRAEDLTRLVRDIWSLTSSITDQSGPGHIDWDIPLARINATVQRVVAEVEDRRFAFAELAEAAGLPRDTQAPKVIDTITDRLAAARTATEELEAAREAARAEIRRSSDAALHLRQIGAELRLGLNATPSQVLTAFRRATASPFAVAEVATALGLPADTPRAAVLARCDAVMKALARVVFGDGDGVAGDDSGG